MPCTQKERQQNVWLLPVGSATSNPVRLLNSRTGSFKGVTGIMQGFCRALWSLGFRLNVLNIQTLRMRFALVSIKGRWSIQTCYRAET